MTELHVERPVMVINNKIHRLLTNNAIKIWQVLECKYKNTLNEFEELSIFVCKKASKTIWKKINSNLGILDIQNQFVVKFFVHLKYLKAFEQNLDELILLRPYKYYNRSTGNN